MWIRCRRRSSLHFSFGLVEFSATDCGIGATLTIQIDYTAALPERSELFKFSPSVAGGEGAWYSVPGAAISEFSAIYSVTDGELGDSDLTANGTIVDPVGVGALGVVVDIPTLDSWGLALLVLMLAALGWLGSRSLSRGMGGE
ncbi:MAG: IPTL-CTERM sorting domain-containing protein [Acidobacteriota bacterium]